MIIKIFDNLRTEGFFKPNAVKIDCIKLNPLPVSYYRLCEKQCAYNELVFGKTGGKSHEKDYTSFLEAKVLTTDSIEYELYKNDSLVAELNNSDLGTHYPTFANKPLYVGFVIDWTLVLAAHGAGMYYVKIIKNIMGTDIITYSHDYKLFEFSWDLANKTIKIESWQNGNIIANSLDYTNLIDGGWFASIRINGFFGNKTPKITTDHYLNSAYESLQIQDKITNEYKLESGLIPSSIANYIIYDMLLGNIVKMSDYNNFNSEEYLRKEVILKDFDEVKHFTYNRNIKISCKFEDKKQNIIKHN